MQQAKEFLLLSEQALTDGSRFDEGSFLYIFNHLFQGGLSKGRFYDFLSVLERLMGHQLEAIGIIEQ